MKAAPGTPRGFTLVEAVAALTVVGAVLVTALAAVAGDVRAGRAAVEAQRVSAAAATALERVAHRSRRELLEDQGVWRRLAPPLDDLRWRFRVASSPRSPDLLRVSLRVRGTAGSARESVATLLFRPAPGGGR